MWTRREFGKISAAAFAALATRNAFAADNRAIGAQLYTARHQAQKDLAAVLKGIRQIGYAYVESYSDLYHKYSARQIRQLVSDNGLLIPSGHFDYDTFHTHMDFANELGLDYMVCPMLPKRMWNLDGFRKAADQFNTWAATLQKRRMKFAFHNHNYEFTRDGATTGYDTLLANTDPKLVFFEMDCYWVTQAGGDPVKMLQAHPQRIRMLHLKDRKPGFPPSHQLDAAAGHFTEVGTGTIDWKAILNLAQKNKVDYMFVEQDETERSPLESLRISYNNLQKLLS